MTTLNLGVLDTAYRHGPSRTTFEVAKILEKRYGIMGFFWDTHGAEIGDWIATDYADTMVSVMKGAPYHQPGLGAMSKVETRFKHMLSQQELDGMVKGVPTQASLDGVSHRFKHPYAKRAPRPSFIDTGLYQASFKAWLTK